MVHPPGVYAALLGKKIAEHKSACWLVNTGWTGGPFGIGKRMGIAHTRAALRAALSGALDNVETMREPVFGLEIPLTCPDVPSEFLIPRNTWSDKSAYDAMANELAGRFQKNFADVGKGAAKVIEAAGPRM